MANAKNTIQNIPLTGSLNLNTLKTDVKAFQGFNEKNSTVFGGELSPFYAITHNYENVTMENTVPMVNNNGKILFIRSTFDAPLPNPYNNKIEIYNTEGQVEYTASSNVFANNKIDVPSRALWAAQIYTIAGLLKVYIDNDGIFYYQGRANRNIQPNAYNVDSSRIYYPDETLKNYPLQSYPSINLSELADATRVVSQIFSPDSNTIICQIAFLTSTNIGNVIFKFTKDNTNNNFTVLGSFAKRSITDLILTVDADISINTAPSFQGLGGKLLLYTNTGKLTDSSFKCYSFTYTGSSLGEAQEETNIQLTKVYSENSSSCLPNGILQNDGEWAKTNPSVTDSVLTYRVSPYYGEVNRFIGATVDFTKYNNFYADAKGFNNLHGAIITGNDGTGFVPHYKNISLGNTLSLSFIDNYMVSFNYNDIPVIAPNNSNFDSKSLVYMGDGVSYGYCYKINDAWYSFIGLNKTAELNTPSRGRTEVFRSAAKLIENLIIDGRYLLLLDRDYRCIYDLDTEEVICSINGLCYVPESVPKVTSNMAADTQTVFFASGYNAGYENNPKNPFLGYLPNPVIMTSIPVGTMTMTDMQPNLQYYLTTGGGYASSKYIGNDPKYVNTIYPISNTGNIIYPFSLNSKIINGYYNNDMIFGGDSSFPLIYYNNNIKKYGYFALASVYNIKGTFVVQGQQFAYDDNNIYSAVFENGIISSVNSICYIKNMTYIGALPSYAIFYSEYNKTFYRFSGDNLLTKMIEASDIDDIKAVYMNPSTLSLWVTTEDNIYVISETDMIKLGYNDILSIKFLPDGTYIINTKDFRVISNFISFLKKPDSEIVPIKLSTSYYGLGSEQKATYDCWYFRLHAADKREGYLDIKIHTVTDVSKETETKRFPITAADYDENNIVYLKYQPKYQSAVAMQIEAETNLAVYQLSLGVNANDTVAQMSKNNF